MPALRQHGELHPEQGQVGGDHGQRLPGRAAAEILGAGQGGGRDHPDLGHGVKLPEDESDGEVQGDRINPVGAPGDAALEGE
nr:hypothetical protein [Luteolibacter rhizosphaerae]